MHPAVTTIKETNDSRPAQDVPLDTSDANSDKVPALIPRLLLSLVEDFLSSSPFSCSTTHDYPGQDVQPITIDEFNLAPAFQDNSIVVMPASELERSEGPSHCASEKNQDTYFNMRSFCENFNDNLMLFAVFVHLLLMLFRKFLLSPSYEAYPMYIENHQLKLFKENYLPQLEQLKEELKKEESSLTATAFQEKFNQLIRTTEDYIEDIKATKPNTAPEDLQEMEQDVLKLLASAGKALTRVYLYTLSVGEEEGDKIESAPPDKLIFQIGRQPQTFFYHATAARLPEADYRSIGYRTNNYRTTI